MNAHAAFAPDARRRVIPGTPIFGPDEAARGYALNAMCFSFNDAANRAAFRFDPPAYCERYGLDAEQTRAVLARDVPGMIAAGGNIYYLAKLAGIYGLNVQDIGAQQTGTTVEQFRQRLLDQGKGSDMAAILGGIFTSHVPAIGNAIAKNLQDDPYWSAFFAGFAPVHAWLESARPDVAIVFYNDHGLNFFLDTLPTFAIGTAAAYRNSDEGWGLPLFKPFEGAPALSAHLVESLVADEFDMTVCQEMLIDHALAIPFALCWPDASAWPVRIVPIAINTVQHPLPSPRRCLALGRAVGRALARWPGDDRIVVLGTGGLSHQLDGARAGFLNPDYDRFCLDHIADFPEQLAAQSALDIVEKAGSQGVELLNWIAARGALGADVVEVARNYHIPISNTAAATMLLECRDGRSNGMDATRFARTVSA